MSETAATADVLEGTKPKPFVFVLMPFAPEFGDIYELGIKAACVDSGAYCERVDEQQFTESILQRLYNQIAKADIIVADMTGRNPNVFYEVGYAHALNKRVILLTQNADDIPFDLKHYPHIVYEGKITKLKQELAKRIRWSIANPLTSLSAADSPIGLYLEEQKISDGAVVPCMSSGRLGLRFMVQNEGDLTIEPNAFQLVVEIPYAVFSMDDASYVRYLPDKRISVRMPDFGKLFPKAWTECARYLHLMEPKPREMDSVVMLYTPFGPRRYNVKLVEHESRAS
jgi:hypothetical protein